MSDSDTEFDFAMPDLETLFPDNPAFAEEDVSQPEHHSLSLQEYSTKVYKTKQLKAIKLMGLTSHSNAEIKSVKRGLCAALTMEWLKMMKERADDLKSSGREEYGRILMEYYSHVLSQPPVYMPGGSADEYYTKLARLWQEPGGTKDLQLQYLEVGSKARAELKKANNEATKDELISGELAAQMKFLMKQSGLAERFTASVPEPTNSGSYKEFWNKHGYGGSEGSFADIIKGYIDDEKKSGGGTFIGIIAEEAPEFLGPEKLEPHAVGLYLYPNVIAGGKEFRAIFFDPNFGTYEINNNREREFFAELEKVYMKAYSWQKLGNIQIVLGVK